MALEAEGVPILSRGDYSELIVGLDDHGPSIEPLAAWLHGEPVSPEDLHECLDIACRARIVTDRARAVIDAACQRLEEAFPGRLIAV